MQRVDRLYYNLTPAALEDELLYLLSSKNECEVIEDNGEGNTHIHIFHPYLNQAEGLIYKININDRLEFVIWEEDVPLGLAVALKKLGKVEMKQIVTGAVRRLYESVNPEYYHINGIHGNIRWGFGSE